MVNSRHFDMLSIESLIINYNYHKESSSLSTCRDRIWRDTNWILQHYTEHDYLLFESRRAKDKTIVYKQ